MRPEPVKRGDAGRVSGHYGVTAIALRRYPGVGDDFGAGGPRTDGRPEGRLDAALRLSHDADADRPGLRPALDAVTAEDAKDYRIIGPGGQSIAIRKAVYDPADRKVTLHPVERINIHQRSS